METAKANVLVPRKYIEYLLEKIPQLSVPSDFGQLKAYLPWTEEVQAECH
nr:transposase domain-containing protein [Lactiplantibacillus dongliensis]